MEKGPDQGVDQDVQSAAGNIRLPDVAAMAVDERDRWVGCSSLPEKHIGALLEVSEPHRIMGMLAAPSLSDFFLRTPNFEACSAGGPSSAGTGWRRHAGRSTSNCRRRLMTLGLPVGLLLFSVDRLIASHSGPVLRGLPRSERAFEKSASESAVPVAV